MNQVNRDFRGFWASEALRGSHNFGSKKITKSENNLKLFQIPKYHIYTFHFINFLGAKSEKD